jgi:hypothetical protein
LLLAPAQAVESFVAQRPRAHALQRLIGHAHILGGVEGREAQIRLTPHEHHLQHAEMKRRLAALRHHGHTRGHLAAAHRYDVASAQRDRPRRRHQRAG